MASQQPAKLTRTPYERVWGIRVPSGKKIGEDWYTSDQPLPILVKFLFTSANLSVQVHPDGKWGVGKTEMWHILRSDPGARIALGFTEPITPDTLRAAAASGEIERLLRWIPVSPGETYFIPAGTVHAIGSGITICEIQQNSDITYRLYDYGRPRELHLDQGVAATDHDAWWHPGACVAVDLADGWKRLVECRYFATDSRKVTGKCRYQSDPSRFELLICLEGAGRLNAQKLAAGDVWLLPAGSTPIEITTDSALSLLRTYESSANS